jgi:DNA invertase Pin-like site-specific DNA recombinase
MSMKEALKKVQKDLESAQAELSKLYDLVDNLEKTVGGIKAEKPVKAKPGPKKAAPKKTTKSKPKSASKGTATERVLGVISKSPEGISTDAIMKHTGLERKTVYGVLNKAKKLKKVKSLKRGTYVSA